MSARVVVRLANPFCGNTAASVTNPRQDQAGVDYPALFGSAHGNGCYFALCDGSVQFLPSSINPQTLKKLFIRNDGEMIDQEEMNR